MTGKSQLVEKVASCLGKKGNLGRGEIEKQIGTGKRVLFSISSKYLWQVYGM